MDSLTHIAIGACIGEGMLGKDAGKKAMLYGALAQSLPDIDFIAAAWLSPTENLLAHRSFTHSILFVLAVTAITALLSGLFNRSQHITNRKWSSFVAVNLFIHIFLDAFNAYGTGWFEPFSTYRVSFHSLFVADPFFSIVPGIAFMVLLLLPKKNRGRMKWVKAGLLLPALYLLVSLFNKQLIDRKIRSLAAKEGISYKRSFSTPTAFNNLLWYVALENDSGYYIAYRSVLDGSKELGSHYYPRHEYLLKQVTDTIALRQLQIFSQGYYTVEKQDDSIVFNILRFGQQAGWSAPSAPFVFRYYLNGRRENGFTLQQGRFAGWNKHTVQDLVNRMLGR